MAVQCDGVTVRRGLTFATGLVECLCFAGAVFGWASLVFVLKTDGYFGSGCVNVTNSNATQALGQFEVLLPTAFNHLFTLILAVSCGLLLDSRTGGEGAPHHLDS